MQILVDNEDGLGLDSHVAMCRDGFCFSHFHVFAYNALGARLACFCVQNCRFTCFWGGKKQQLQCGGVLRAVGAKAEGTLMRKLNGASHLVLSSLSDVSAMWEMVVNAPDAGPRPADPWRVPCFQGRSVSQSLSISDLGACKSLPHTPRSGQDGWPLPLWVL